MSWFYADIIIQNVPLDITTQQIYESMNDQLDNGILTISEEVQCTPYGKRKNFTICAECRRHNPIFNKMDVRERLIIYINQNGKHKRVRFNVVIH
jgi:hypothetical protein